MRRRATLAAAGLILVVEAWDHRPPPLSQQEKQSTSFDSFVKHPAGALVKSERSLRLIGVLAIFIAAILFGVAGAVAKILFVANVSPLDLTALRTFVACAVLGLIMISLPGRQFHVARKD